MQMTITQFGHWLAKHQRWIRSVQWIIILIYATLIIIPVFLPLPDETATLFHHFTVFAGFLFWGIWWPFVIISIILFGRLWCGILCPEGALSEIANRHGLGKTIPSWLRWRGWPFVAFGITTIYGQMVSVYQYPKPVMLILGGSTIAAIIVGFLYGKSNRVWCKYLCPVTGVFALLARLAPWRYQPMHSDWTKYQMQSISSVRCPTLLPLTRMTGSANCLMCGKCGIEKNDIQLRTRSMNEEIVKYGGLKNNIFDSILIIYGLCGLALAAFQWPTSFWFAHFREVIESWLLAHQITWIFNTNAPWWLFTHYPEQGDVFSWIYGFQVIAYIILVGCLLGVISTILISFSVKTTGKLTLPRFNHLSQALIPLGGCSVFIGLLGNTTTLLQKYANIGFIWINEAKYLLLLLATVWSAVLAYQIIKRYTTSFIRKIVSLSFMILNIAIINYSWFLVLHVWAAKADSIPWNQWW